MKAKRLDQYTQEQIQTAQKVVAAYNSASTSCTRYKQPENVAAVIACVTYAEAHGETVDNICRSAKAYVKDMGGDLSLMSLQGFCSWTRAAIRSAAAIDDLQREAATARAEVDKMVEAEARRLPAYVPEDAPAADFSSALNIIATAVAREVATVKAADIQAQLQNDVRDYIAKEYGPIERKVTFDLGDTKYTPKGIVHEKFETILQFVRADEPVFLTGAAGSGKNVICKQVAEALGLQFYFTNAVTQEYKLTGFTDAMGNFHESQFYRAFRDGGVFMLDEMDASIPEVLVILNAAIANGYFDFPAPIGYVEAHKDFRIIAAGNTVGLGADSQYVGRTQLDAASLDRFAIVKVEYSDAIENAVGLGNEELVSFCRAFRAATQKAGIQAIVSYRAIGRMAKMLTVLDHKTVLETCLVKGMEKSDLSGYGKFSAAFKKIVQEVA